MSLDTLASMEVQKTFAVEEGIFSQDFILDPSGSAITFKGIFDNSHEEEKKDGGGVTKNAPVPRIMVAEILVGFIRGAVVIDVLENGDPGPNTWKISRADKDSEGIPLIWLY